MRHLSVNLKKWNVYKTNILLGQKVCYQFLKNVNEIYVFNNKLLYMIKSTISNTHNFRLWCRNLRTNIIYPLIFFYHIGSSLTNDKFAHLCSIKSNQIESFEIYSSDNVWANFNFDDFLYQSIHSIVIHIYFTNWNLLKFKKEIQNKHSRRRNQQSTMFMVYLIVYIKIIYNEYILYVVDVVLFGTLKPHSLYTLQYFNHKQFRLYSAFVDRHVLNYILITAST